MPHKRHAETAKRIYQTEYGVNVETNAQADKWLLDKPETLTAFAVMNLSQQFADVVESIVAPLLIARLRTISEAFSAEVSRRKAEMIKLHGPMPFYVSEWISREARADLADRLLNTYFHGLASGSSFDYHKRPPKGSDLRREYDAYMRRKVKPASKPDDLPPIHD